MITNRAHTPLRYPGGKSKLTRFVYNVLISNHINGTYIEPFSGGAGISINLLLNGSVDKIVINDLDSSVYSFWNYLVHDTKKFILSVKNVPIDYYQKNDLLEPSQKIDLWNFYRQQYLDNKAKYNFKEAFAFFMLNRMNRSGIITGGPIGGKKQNGEYSISSRFNKNNLIKQLSDIGKKSDRIIVQNSDALTLLNNLSDSKRYFPPENSFIFIDPPYFGEGKELYPSYMEKNEHFYIADTLTNMGNKYHWLVTYDKVAYIADLYREHKIQKFEYGIRYSAARKRLENELMFVSNNTLLSDTGDVFLENMSI